jgi:hypothetical protein
MTSNVNSLEPATGGTVVADGRSSLKLTATVTGDTTSGVAVTWNIDTGSNIASLTTDAPATDASGLVTANLTATDVGDIIVRAYTSEDTSSGGKTTTISASAPTAEGSYIGSCESSLEFISVDSENPLPSEITATVVDLSGNPMADIDVTWTVTNGTPDSTTSTSDANGIARVSVTAIAVGAVIVTATTADDTTGKSAPIVALQPTHPEPMVTNASSTDNYTLDSYDVQFGVEAEVPLYGGNPGDNVTLFWGSYSRQFVVTDPEQDLPRVINISDDLPSEALNDGQYWVHYQVLDNNGNPGVSSARLITVEQGGETVPTLPKPQVPAANDGSINIPDASLGVQVTAASSQLVEGDVVNLYWKGFTNNDLAISGATTSDSKVVAAGETSVTFTLDTKWFFPFEKEGYEGHAEAFYTVKPADSTATALSQTLRVIVDTVAS